MEGKGMERQRSHLVGKVMLFSGGLNMLAFFSLEQCGVPDHKVTHLFAMNRNRHTKTAVCKNLSTSSQCSRI